MQPAQRRLKYSRLRGVMSSSRSSSTIGVLELSDPVRRANVRESRSTHGRSMKKESYKPDQRRLSRPARHHIHNIDNSQTFPCTISTLDSRQQGAGKYTLINIVDIDDRAGLWPRRDPKLQCIDIWNKYINTYTHCSWELGRIGFWKMGYRQNGRNNERFYIEITMSKAHCF
jgi:hypothetical protein